MAPRLLDAITSIINAVLGHKLDYLAQYSATVLSQRADGSLDVQLDSLGLKLNAPIRYGLPGVSAKVLPGGKCMVGFEAGAPSLPYVTIWETATITEISVTGLQLKLGNNPVDTPVPTLALTTYLSSLTLYLSTLKLPVDSSTATAGPPPSPPPPVPPLASTTIRIPAL